MNRLATERYGAAATPFIRRAWTAFSTAMQEYPYSGGVLYFGPQQLGPANLLYAKPTGYHATMVGFPYDDLKQWRNIYPAEIFINQFDHLAQQWKGGLDIFTEAINLAKGVGRQRAEEDLHLAEATYLHFASVVNQARFVEDRDSLLSEKTDNHKTAELKRHINDILDQEIGRARELYSISRADSRVGFEASNQYYYFPQDLRGKVIDCEYVRRILTGDNNN